MIHTGDGAFYVPVKNEDNSVILPVPCWIRPHAYVVIVSGFWDRRFPNGIAAQNIARRVGGKVYKVEESQFTGREVRYDS